jgi:hypothetical protein
MHVDLLGGGGLKFGDVIMATASAAVIHILIEGVLVIALVPTGSYLGVQATVIVSILVSGLIVGYVFARKIWEESRIISIGKIAILSAFLTLFAVMASFGAIGHYSALVDESLQNMFSTGSWTSTDWYSYEVMVLASSTALNVAYTLALGFVGLYLGSMRKPAAKTKE